MSPWARFESDDAACARRPTIHAADRVEVERAESSRQGRQLNLCVGGSHGLPRAVDIAGRAMPWPTRRRLANRYGGTSGREERPLRVRRTG